LLAAVSLYRVFTKTIRPTPPQVEYRKIKEIRSAPRGGGLWGDVVIFLKDGSRLPLAGLERHREIVDHIEGFIIQ
jgi:hypothetical protein